MSEQEEIRQGIQHLWCQHCKALQKSSGCQVECWYNPLDAEGHFAFCAANDDAVDAILKGESEKGVVIKVDREFPKIAIPNHSRSTSCPHCGEEFGYEDIAEAEQHEYQDKVKEAGYVATMPLIDKEVKHDTTES